MGKNNKARRAAAARQRARRRAQGGDSGRAPGGSAEGFGPGSFHQPPPGEVAELAWLAAAGVDPGSGGVRSHQAIPQLAAMPRSVVLPAAESLLHQRIRMLWDNGWQPAELYRQVRLAGISSVATQVAQLALAVECTRVLGSALTLHPQWRAQAQELAVGRREFPELDGWLDSCLPDGALGHQTYRVIAEAITTLWWLPVLDQVLPPPGRPAPVVSARARGADPVLERVRALLSKAESTEFEAEATALTAKAQELITRHAIDLALLTALDDNQDREPILIRLPVDPPYADAKALLLQTIAEATRCRAISAPDLHLSSVVGLPDDLDAVELLFTSLLVQAQHGLAEAARGAPPGSQPRSQGFRSAFLAAYAQRIGERLAEINQHVFSAAAGQSSAFLPVLRSQQDAIDDFMARRFPDTYTGAVRGGYSPFGWFSGRQAADLARLNTADLDPAEPRHPAPAMSAVTAA